MPRVRLRVVLAGHVAFTLLYSILFANVVWMMPLLVRLRFGAVEARWRDWQTTLVTAAVPAFMTLSIFWGELLRRTTVRGYLLVFFTLAVVPLGCVGLVQNYWQLLGCHIVATIGLAGWTPLNGKLLKHFYPDAVRGRAFAVVNAVMLASGATSVYLVGAWMEAVPHAFRVYFPAAAGVQVLGMGLLLWLVRLTGTETQPVERARSSWATLLHPILHMGQVLRADRAFLRYENAFMTYGAAWMLCDALLPVLATSKLGMRYEEYAHSTQAAMRLAMLLVVLPMGWLHDRIGPVRMSGLAFLALAAYPLLLLAADGAPGVAGASLVYGAALAGVQMTWMLGPLALAGSAEKAPQYAAIHATLVGIRGIVFQGLGMLLYQLTGTFTWPLVAATLAFLWAAAQMWRLHGIMSAPSEHLETRLPEAAAIGPDPE